MRISSGKIPAFSAGPLLMPPIQLMGLRIQSSIPAIQEQNLRNGTRMNDPGKSTNLRRYGTRFLFAARVRPLTLSALMRDETTGVLPLSQLEADQWAEAKGFRLRRDARSTRQEESL
jgi:hypothetical protein